MMKKLWSIISVLTISIMFVTACTGSGGQIPTGDDDSALRGVVKTGGSSSVEKVMNALIYQFQEDHAHVTINYEMNGSGDGINNTLNGMYDIGHVSRELKQDGTEDGLHVIPYAVDGITIVVHPKNNVSDLTGQQVQDIYTGRITNWNQVGGADAPITVITREMGSGTRSTFAQIIGLEQKAQNGRLNPDTQIMTDAVVANNTGAVQTQIMQNPNAIGYLSYSEVNTDAVKLLRFDGVDISAQTLQNDTYKLKRDFYLLTKKDAPLSNEAQAFIDFVVGDRGRQIILHMKLIPIASATTGS